MHSPVDPPETNDFTRLVIHSVWSDTLWYRDWGGERKRTNGVERKKVEETKSISSGRKNTKNATRADLCYSHGIQGETLWSHRTDHRNLPLSLVHYDLNRNESPTLGQSTGIGQFIMSTTVALQKQLEADSNAYQLLQKGRETCQGVKDLDSLHTRLKRANKGSQGPSRGRKG